MALPAQGRVSYGQLDLSGPAMLTTGIQVRPVLDTARRTRLYNVYTISLKLWIAGSPTDAAVKLARSQLTTPGLAFAYQDKGFSDVVVNIKGIEDAEWGPMPKVMGFKPLAGRNACEITWEVDVALVECGENALRAGGAGFDGLELTWGASYATDASGYTTRTLTVFVRIAGYRAGADGRKLTDTADTYRELVSPPQVPGFRRTYGPWIFNEAKTEFRGQVVDAEIGPNYPPEWVVDVKASHEVSGMTTWGCTISADYEVAKNVPAGFDPIRHFLGVLVRDRISAIAAAIGKDSRSIVPLNLSMTEPEIYGKNRKASYRFGFQFTQSLAKILGSTGQWRPVPGSDWKLWAATMQIGAAHPRGFAQMVLSPGDDSIVDGCGGRVPPVFSSTPNVPAPPAGPRVVGVPSPPTIVDLTSNPAEMPGTNPTAASSWVMYECWIWVECDSGTIPVRPLPAKPPLGNLLFPGIRVGEDGLPLNWFDALGVNPLVGAALPPNPRRPGGNLEPDAQQRVKPLVYVYLRGRAIRHGFPVPIPQLMNVAGVKPILACRLDRGEGFGQGRIAAAGEQVLFGSQWNLRYQLADLPRGWFPPVPPNPLLDSNFG